jgi:hypothetical protein
MAIYVHRNDQRLGPFTVTEVKSQLASGALSIHDHVWWKGQPSWIPLGGSAVLEPGFQDPSGAIPKKTGGLTGLSSFSIAAVIAGALFPLSFFSSIPAIVFGHFALDEIKKNPGRTGRGLALVGLGLGYTFTLLSAAIVGCYLYFHDEVEATQLREEALKADVFVPAVPSTPAPAPTTTNLSQPVSPAPASPTNAPPHP